MKRWITPILSVVTIFYTVWYMHFGVPYKNDGALSTIGLSHHNAFVVWGVLTMLTFGVGIIIAYKSTLKTRIYIPMLLVSVLGMTLTLCFDFDYDIKPDYYFHCVGSLLFSVVTGVVIFVLFLLNYKRNAMFKIFTYLTAVILLVDFVLLLIYKETGFIEIVPVFAGYIMLSLTNFRRERVEATR